LLQLLGGFGGAGYRSPWSLDNYASCCAWRLLANAIPLHVDRSPVTIFSLLLGYPLAYFLSFHAGSGKIFLSVVIIPFVG